MTPKAKPFTTETKLVRELAEIFDEKELTELELETDDISIRLARGQTGQQIVAMPQQVVGSVAQQAAPSAAPAPGAARETSTNTTSSDFSAHEGAVLSPMVGTVYRAPEPGAANFINEGDAVKKGQTLFIVEAMKVMNPITASSDGKVTKILVENAQPIEFDQPLAIIE
ncbi:MAG: acetyl-CoA carboxylase, biotin carboxyl carrier protein [Rhodospirillaceae bacterium]|nr:acetyl-CoA carboxylase, biotin carboxyl carrier protein [Rhodospirillaceae bacterium]